MAFDGKDKILNQLNGVFLMLGLKTLVIIVDLSYVPSNEKAILKQNILQGAVDKGSDAGIIFLNDI